MVVQQPQDGWGYLRPDELADDGVVAALDRVAQRQAEELAMHVERSDGAGHLLGDPARRDVDVGPGDGEGPPAHFFDDEEPEGAPPPAEPDVEPDLEDILESQHYSFGPADD